MRLSADMAAAVVLALLGGLAALVPGVPAFIRVPLAAPLVLVVPGFVLSRAIFAERALEPIELGVLSVALSFVLAILGGLLLNLFPSGLTVSGWTVLLCGVTVALCAVTLIRRSRTPQTASAGPAHVANSPVAGMSTRTGGFLLGAAVLVVAAVWLARTPVPGQALQGYTILWMVPAGDSADSVQLGVRSFEITPVEYQLRVVSGEQVLQEFSIKLQPVDEWQAEISLPALGSAPLEADLYRADAPQTVYRRTILHGGT